MPLQKIQRYIHDILYLDDILGVEDDINGLFEYNYEPNYYNCCIFYERLEEVFEEKYNIYPYEQRDIEATCDRICMEATFHDTLYMLQTIFNDFAEYGCEIDIINDICEDRHGEIVIKYIYIYTKLCLWDDFVVYAMVKFKEKKKEREEYDLHLFNKFVRPKKLETEDINCIIASYLC